MRAKPPNRRLALTHKVSFEQSNGKTVSLLVTIGFDKSTNRVAEVFCADFKAGSDNQAIVMDSCILLSRLFQHGDRPEDVMKSLTNSLIRALCEVAAKEDAV